MFLELTKTSRMPEVTFHYWFFGRFIIFCCRNAVFFFLIEFWFAALFASHSSLEISTCGIKSDKPQNKLFQRKSISCEEKKIRHLRISSRLLMRFSKVFSRHFRSLLGMLIRHFKPSTHLPRILEYF